MKLGKAASDVKIDIKLSTIKPIHASWIVAAFQQVTKETLIPLLSSSEYQFINEFLIFLLNSQLQATSNFIMSEHKITYC
jgi:hypothetical protein